MSRKKDGFREYVTFLDEKESRWKCKHCGKEYGGGGRRIKAQCAKECEIVDDTLCAKALLELCGKQVQYQDGAGNGNESS